MMRALIERFTACWPPACMRPTSAGIRLRVTDEDGVVLADIADAARGDFLLPVPLESATVTVDLRPHLDAAAAGGGGDYVGADVVCHTYVKFGHCIQERRPLRISISIGRGDCRHVGNFRDSGDRR